MLSQPGLSSFVHYTTDHGLSNDNIRDILKDRQGFLWIATQYGLNRFDGHSFRKFFHEPNNVHSLPDSYVKFLTLAPDGSLWASGDYGVCYIDPSTLEFRRFVLPENKDTIDGNDHVGRVVFDSSGRGWVSAKDGLYSFDLSTHALTYHAIGLPYAGKFTTYCDQSDKIWLVERDIISYFDTKTNNLKTLPTDTPGNPLAGSAPLNLCEDQYGKLWLATWFRGLAWYDPKLDSLIDYPDSNMLTSTIFPEKNNSGSLWLGGGKYGLFYFNPETREDKQFPPDPRDPFTHNNYIATALFRDEKVGSLWVGTEAGLEYYSPASMRFDRVILPIDASFGQFSLTADALQDANDPTGDTYYIAMWGSGLFKWNRKRHEFEHFHEGNSKLQNDGIFCAMQDFEGQIWLGTNGIIRFNPHLQRWDYWEVYSSKLGENMIIMSCIKDTDGGLWFGSNKGGLFHFNAALEKIEEVELPPEAYAGGNKLRIVGMDIDRHGWIWLATHQRPIRFNPRTKEAIVFQVSNTKSEHNKWSDVLVSRSGILYAANDNCLLELDSNCVILRKFDQQNGLRSNQLFRLAEDRKGHIWANTAFLLHCLDPKSGRFNYYGTADGLFKNTVTDALVTMPSGEIFIGFQNAFNHFNPNRLLRNTTPPPVVITSIKVMDAERRPVSESPSFWERFFSKKQKTEIAKKLVLRPKDEMLTIEFAALSFNQPKRNRYAYMLEGFNEDWVYTDVNFATYTNLDGGEYLFRIKAANNDGVWNEVGTSLAVEVIPPFTHRWYFFALVGLLTGLILWSILKYRSIQRQRLESFREGLARDLHDEMGSTLSSIRFFSEYAKTLVSDEKNQVVSILQRIILSASALSESMQDIVWAMRQDNDQLEDLGARMTEFGLRIFEAKGIAFKAHINEYFSGKSLSPEVRRNLYLIFKEAVNNTAKYAEASNVELFLSMKKGLLMMSISDDGVGIEQSETPENWNGGNGLKNMQQRAEEVNGTLEVITEKNSGTKIEVRVRI